MPIKERQGFYKVTVVAENIILGIPKRSIQILYNEIDIFQNPITNYNYENERLEFQQIFNYNNLKDWQNKIGN